METPEQRRRRLAGALQDLIGQEAACVAAEEFSALPAIQARTARLIQELADDPAAPADCPVAEQIAANLRVRAATLAKIASAISAVEARLRTHDSSRRRIAQVTPAYRHAGCGASRLSAVG